VAGPLRLAYVLKATVVFATILAVAIPHMRTYHPFARFGPANQVTTLRALLVALVSGLIGEPHDRALIAIVLAGTATALDGVDGWLARRSGMVSAFGAQFDVEMDALLILMLSILAWREGKAGMWVLASGLTRYGFVAAGTLLPWLRRPLPGSMRAKTICVFQVCGLLVVLLPRITPPASNLVAAVSLAALWYSFAVDVQWLALRRSEP
jgi:phosphatidylglycerophosphate synthase